MMARRYWALAFLVLLAVTVSVGVAERVANGPIQVPVLPHIPVSVTFRKSLMGNGLVAQFYNYGTGYYKVRARFENKTLGESQDAVLDLPPRETTEWGWGEGWAFSSGEWITLQLEGYQDFRMQVP